MIYTLTYQVRIHDVDKATQALQRRACELGYDDQPVDLADLLGRVELDLGHDVAPCDVGLEVLDQLAEELPEDQRWAFQDPPHSNLEVAYTPDGEATFTPHPTPGRMNPCD